MNYEIYLTAVCDNGSCDIVKLNAMNLEDAKSKIMQKYIQDDISDTLDYDDFADELYDKYGINLGYPYTIDEL